MSSELTFTNLCEAQRIVAEMLGKSLIRFARCNEASAQYVVPPVAQMPINGEVASIARESSDVKSPTYLAIRIPVSGRMLRRGSTI